MHPVGACEVLTRNKSTLKCGLRILNVIYLKKGIIILGGKERSNIKQGLKVKIVLKQDQKSGKLTEGVVQDILTKSPTHFHGIKVRLTSEAVGRVKEICE